MVRAAVGGPAARIHEQHDAVVAGAVGDLGRRKASARKRLCVISAAEVGRWGALRSRDAAFQLQPRRSGGIGRRASLRGWCPQGRGGSSPPSDTHLNTRVWTGFDVDGALPGVVGDPHAHRLGVDPSPLLGAGPSERLEDLALGPNQGADLGLAKWLLPWSCRGQLALRVKAVEGTTQRLHLTAAEQILRTIPSWLIQISFWLAPGSYPCFTSL